MTIKDVAQLAGVSITTVSKIMNNRDGNISDATRNRVKKVIEENNYITNSVARGLKTKKTNIIGFVLPDIVNPYYPEIARGIEDAARDRDFGVIFCNTDNHPEREKECLDFLMSKMVDGIIYTRTLKGSNVQYISEVSIPVVIVDRFVNIQPKKTVGRVYVDVSKAIYDSTVMMAKAGCKNIACISSSYTDSTDRYFGYLKALEELGIKHSDKLVYLDEFTIETGYKGIQNMLDSGAEIDGVVCGNDLIAIGVLNVLKDRGVLIPKDIKVIGVDNIYLSNFTNPRLSTMAQPTRELGEIAANMLIDHLKDGKPLIEKVLNHAFVDRETI